MGLLRSDVMSFCNMFIQPEAAFHIISQLGELGRVQFEDMTPSLPMFQRNYTTDMCRYTEQERILRFIESEMNKENLVIPPMVGPEPPAMRIEELNELETAMDKYEKDITEFGKYQTKLLENLQVMQEMLYVLNNISPIIGDAELQKEVILANKGDSAGGDTTAWGGKLHVRTGVVRRTKAFAFETMLWRISRGNIYFRPVTMDTLITDPQSGTLIRYVAFIALCQGEQLKTSMDKVCAGFHAHLHDVPQTYAERNQLVESLETRISDLDKVLQKSKYHRCKLLRSMGQTWWYNWIRVKKSKATYYVMNQFSMDITKKCLIGQGWAPTADLIVIQDIFKNCSISSGSEVDSFINVASTYEDPPTFYRVNKYTRAFQALIDAYGDSLYREINPGMFTCITFPFLFSVMFGDCGHGLIMLSFALWMVIKEKELMQVKSTNEIWNIFFGGRYVILSMAISTMYTGFLYNDWFSKPLRLKANYFINQYSKATIFADPNATLILDPAAKTNEYYIIGVDPAWAFSKNKIMNENSLKMKLSIILGIIHMLFGLCLSVLNHLYFKKYYAIILEFLPQVIFLLCLFMWLVFLMFFKFFAYGPKFSDIKRQPGCAPLILIQFIDMCLFRETKPLPGSDCEPYMFDGQQGIQKALVLISVVQVPILLFGSPIYLIKTNKKKRKAAKKELKHYLETRESKPKDDEVDKNELALRQKVEHYSESFGELMIHQGVHTIEYVLSTVSHTASYLRLWALSLAHAQLSEMLWGMVLSKLALKKHEETGMAVIMLFIIFAMWAFFSLAILVLMEGLSAFLHTLRLHWVEFMSKFFLGNGRPFRPFSFQEILYGENKEEKEVACPKLVKVEN